MECRQVQQVRPRTGSPARGRPLVAACIGLLPAYAAIGVLAPVLLVVLRLLQGLSAGGEFGGATTFVTEHAPAGRRGWYGSWQWATLALGLAAGIGVAALLAGTLPWAAFMQWGWRLAFLAAVPLGLVGLALAAGTAPLFGLLSDLVGRKPLLVAGVGALLVLTLPAYLLVRRAGPVGLPLAYVLIGLAMSCLVLPAFLAELFPTPLRSTALAITFGLGSALLGEPRRWWTRCWSSVPTIRWPPPTTPSR